MALTKTEGIVLLTHQAITHPNTAKGIELDVTTAVEATVVCYHASVEATANTNPGTFRVMTNPFASGDDGWALHTPFTANTGTAATEALSGTEAIGQTVLEVASTTGFTAPGDVYVQDAGTVGDGEWHRLINVVTNTSLDIRDGLVAAKDSADIVWHNANVFPCDVSCLGKARLRVDFEHLGATGANVHVMALGVTFNDDSIT